MKIKYTNELGQSISFKYSRPFFLNKIDGLGFKNEIKTMKISGWDGVKTTSEQLKDRDISLKCTLVATNKTTLNIYKSDCLKIFNPKLKGCLEIYKKGIDPKKINCKVEELKWGKEIAKTQEIIIRLQCDNPYFTDLKMSNKYIAQWINDISFPICFEGDMEFGHKAKSLFANVANEGDVDTGMQIKFIAKGHVKNPSLFNVNTREFMKVKTEINSGEVIVVTTSKGNKRIELVTSYDKTSVFNKMDLGSEFMQLKTGNNVFRYDADEAVENLEVSIEYVQKYLGV